MSASSLVERIRTRLVGLQMPRALEILDATLRGIERGEIDAIDASLNVVDRKALEAAVNFFARNLEATPAQATIKIDVKRQSKGPQSYAYEPEVAYARQ